MEKAKWIVPLTFWSSVASVGIQPGVLMSKRICSTGLEESLVI